MKLVIDRGNTLFKLGVFDGRDLIEVRYLQELNKSTLEDILLTFDVSKAILCSVGGNLSQDLTDLLKAQTKFLSMSNTLSLPIKISYNNPNALGKDRIAAMVGAREMLKGQNVAVIDAGSCICIDLLDEHSVYQGGVITPGLGMKYRALHTFTANLPLLYLDEKHYDCCQNSTEGCIRSGVQNGTIFEIEGFISRCKEICKDLRIVVSGGDADFVARGLKEETIVDKHVVLKGLNVILDENIEE